MQIVTQNCCLPLPSSFNSTLYRQQEATDTMGSASDQTLIPEQSLKNQQVQCLRSINRLAGEGGRRQGLAQVQRALEVKVKF